jgi:hypothetical protein
MLAVDARRSGLSQTVAEKDAFIGFSEPTCTRFFSLANRLAQRCHLELAGVQNLPRGRAVLVANHAFGFWDLALAVAKIRDATQRNVWSLGEHLWCRCCGASQPRVGSSTHTGERRRAAVGW